MDSPTNFSLVSVMNTAFGNMPGNAGAIDWNRVRKQCLNIADEFGELMIAMGANPEAIKLAVAHLKAAATQEVRENAISPLDVRDALCDIHVFTYGAHHLMGIDADGDMRAVVDGVMTRFIKNEYDKQATIAMHAAAGVSDVYFEGSFPTMVMKSASDQPDAPKGKFLKSASYMQPIFPAVPLPNFMGVVA